MNSFERDQSFEIDAAIIFVNSKKVDNIDTFTVRNEKDQFIYDLEIISKKLQKLNPSIEQLTFEIFRKINSENEGYVCDMSLYRADNWEFGNHKVSQLLGYQCPISCLISNITKALLDIYSDK